MQVPIDFQKIIQVVFKRPRLQVSRCFFKQVPNCRAELFKTLVLLCFKIGFD